MRTNNQASCHDFYSRPSGQITLDETLGWHYNQTVAGLKKTKKRKHPILESAQDRLIETPTSLTGGDWWGTKYDEENHLIQSHQSKMFNKWIKEQYWRYINDISGRSIWLQKENDEHLNLFLNYDYRGSDEWRKKTMDKIPDHSYFKYGHAITLTTDPKRFYSMYHMMHAIKKNWHTLHNALKKKYGSFDFVCVTEWTESGLAHLHVLTTIRQKLDIPWLRKEWKPQGFQVEVKHIRSLKIAKYITKYIRKGSTNPIFWPLFWISQLRFITRSRCFTKIQQKKHEGEWICHGSINYRLPQGLHNFTETELVNFKELLDRG